MILMIFSYGGYDFCGLLSLDVIYILIRLGFCLFKLYLPETVSGSRKVSYDQQIPRECSKIGIEAIDFGNSRLFLDNEESPSYRGGTVP